MGSSGSISPNSILVKIILASRWKISSTPSPLRALASVTTEMPAVLAQRLASVCETSRPSGAIDALCIAPAPIEPACSLYVAGLDEVMADEEKELGTTAVVMVEAEPTLLGVGGGRLVSMRLSDVRSSLFPTSMRLRLGEASARASFRNGCRARKDICEVMS